MYLAENCAIASGEICELDGSLETRSRDGAIEQVIYARRVEDASALKWFS